MQKGFIKAIVMIVIAIVIGFFVSYGYKNFLASPEMINQDAAKNLFNKTLEDTRSGISQTKDSAIDEAKKKAIEELQKGL